MEDVQDMLTGTSDNCAEVERHAQKSANGSGPVAVQSAKQVEGRVARRLASPRSLGSSADSPDPISIQTAIATTGRSHRTWWRRIEDGSVRKLKPDARGRATIALQDVLGLADVGVPSEELMLLIQADAGDPDAQADIGEMLVSTGRPAAGRYFLELAAEQGHPNAMQCLARCYLSGEGGPKNEDLALRWLADAAVRGHVIARGQVRALRQALFEQPAG